VGWYLILTPVFHPSRHSIHRDSFSHLARFRCIAMQLTLGLYWYHGVARRLQITTRLLELRRRVSCNRTNCRPLSVQSPEVKSSIRYNIVPEDNKSKHRLIEIADRIRLIQGGLASWHLPFPPHRHPTSPPAPTASHVFTIVSNLAMKEGLPFPRLQSASMLLTGPASDQRCVHRSRGAVGRGAEALRCTCCCKNGRP
jgi:hypothetical protein